MSSSLEATAKRMFCDIAYEDKKINYKNIIFALAPLIIPLGKRDNRYNLHARQED